MNQHDERPPTGRAEADLLPGPLLSRADDASQEPEESPLLRMHRIMRGRYHWAIILALVGLVGGGYGAAQLWEPDYRSEALLHFTPVIPRVLYRTEETGVMPRFDAHLRSQAAFMSQGRTVTRAMESELWQPHGRGISPDAVDAFERALDVRVDGELIRIRFNDGNPARARAGVQAIVRAYQELYEDQLDQDNPRRIRILEERRTALERRIANLRDRIRTATGEFGSAEALERMYNYRQAQAARLEGRLQDLHLDLAGVASVRELMRQRIGENGMDLEELSLDEIAEFDPEVRQLLQLRRQKLEEKRYLEARGFGERSRQMRRVDSELEVIAQQLEEQVQSFLRSFDPEEFDGQQGAVAQHELRRLQVEQREVERMYEQARSQARDLGARHQELRRLQRELEREQGQLELVERRLEELDVESGIRSRMSVVTAYTDPVAPYNTGSRRQLALFGGVGGASLGFGLVLGLGFLDRRLRSPADAAHSIGRVPLLGLLPAMPEDLADPEQAAIAANGVHHIRTLLQVGSRKSTGGNVFAITSPVSGTGKTSLTIALGLSMASAGSRTLLVDCDFAGGGLSHRMGAIIRRRIGQILVQQGYLSAEQLDQALEHAQQQDLRLGTVLVQRGLVQQEQLDKALSFQEHARLGVLDALAGEPVGHCIADSGIANLSVLPVGSASAADANQLSPEALGRVLDAARSRFDTILIDTGPVPGAVEASIAACVADRVILTVSKGEQRPAAERAVAHLGTLGASIAGLVFNRADEADYHQTSFAALSRSRSTQSGAPLATGTGKGHGRFGPIAGSVANGHSAGNGRDEPGEQT